MVVKNKENTKEIVLKRIKEMKESSSLLVRAMAEKLEKFSTMTNNVASNNITEE